MTRPSTGELIQAPENDPQVDKVTYSTGAVREAAPVPRYDLIPTCVLRRLAERYRLGALKYSPHNWKKGLPWSDTYNRVVEHLQKWLEGNTSDDHLAAVVWGVAALMWYEDHKPECNDIRERWMSILSLDEEGLPSTKTYHGLVCAVTLQEACDLLASRTPEFAAGYDSYSLTYRGCKLLGEPLGGD